MQYFERLPPFFDEKFGLEIGGPSAVFARGSICPVYTVARRLDNCVFSRETVWSSSAAGDGAYRVDAECAPGRQYIAEATDLNMIPSASYDFVLASHTLEHVANPLRALSEWMRVLKEHGMLFIVVPHKQGTFDHRRPVTTLRHLEEDLARGTQETDLTHLAEILELHDLSLDLPAGDLAAFKRRSLKNVENRCLHHHVFDMRLAVEVVDRMGLQVVEVAGIQPYHVFVAAVKLPANQRPANAEFLDRKSACYRNSAFSMDHGERAGA